MTTQHSRCPACGAPIERDQQKSPVAPFTNPQKKDDRETDHRGVLMPRRTRIGGIIMPQ